MTATLCIPALLLLIATPAYALETAVDRCVADMDAAKARADYDACIEITRLCVTATNEYAFAYHQGGCLEALQRWDDAVATYEGFLRDAPAGHPRRADTVQRLEALRRLISRRDERARDARWSEALEAAHRPDDVGVCRTLRRTRLAQQRGSSTAYEEGACFEATGSWQDAKRAYEEFLDRPPAGDAARVERAREGLARAEAELAADPGGTNDGAVAGWTCIITGVVAAGVGVGLLYSADQDTHTMNGLDGSSPNYDARYDELNATREDKVLWGGVALGLGGVAIVTGAVVLLTAGGGEPAASAQPKTTFTPILMPGGAGLAIRGALPF